MNILAIECTHVSFSAAVQRGDAVFEAHGEAWQKTAEGIVPLLGRVMVSGGLERSAIDCVAFSSGPGSFTALRIGISAAKGFAWGLGLPLVAIPTMPAMAFSLPDPSATVLVVIPSRKGEYFYARYSPEERSASVWQDMIERGCADAVISAAIGLPGNGVVVGRQLDELEPLFLASGIRYAGADFFSAASLLPLAAGLCGGADAAGLNEVAPDYRQMFLPRVGGV